MMPMPVATKLSKLFSWVGGQRLSNTHAKASTIIALALIGVAMAFFFFWATKKRKDTGFQNSR
jgi:hypothetical protein